MRTRTRPLSLLRRSSVALIALAMVIAAPLAYGFHGSQNESNPAGQIGAGEVVVDEAMLLSPSLVRAFVPTESASHRCLVTFNESAGGADGSTVFCGSRNVDGVHGLLITINLREPLTDLFLSMTVYQQFAKRYGTPVLYTGD